VIERANKNRDVVLSDLLSGRIDLREVLHSEMFKTIKVEAKKVTDETASYVAHELENRRHRDCDIRTDSVLKE
jgi:hypothetical protein